MPLARVDDVFTNKGLDTFRSMANVVGVTLGQAYNAGRVTRGYLSAQQDQTDSQRGERIGWATYAGALRSGQLIPDLAVG